MWIKIPQINWEYSTTPGTDDPYNAANYVGKHTLGIRTNHDKTQIYVYCRQLGRTHGIGYGEINKTSFAQIRKAQDHVTFHDLATET